MSAVIRRACISSTSRITSCGTRTFSSSTALRAEVTASVGSVKPPKQPVGGFRGGIFGFLVGFSLASSYAAYHLLEEYKQASATLQASVLELQSSTEKVSAHIRRIEAVEKDLKALSTTSATKDDLSRLRTEVKKLYNGLDAEFLKLKSHLWGVEQDLQAYAKKENTSVRV